MASTEGSVAAMKLSDRIESLDVIRGVVLLGILLMNIHGMGLAGAYENPTVSGGAEGWDRITWITTNMLFEGTMRALFSALFGVGMYVLLDRLEKKGAGINAANIYFRRLTWLLFFGLVHAYLLLWDGEILYNYALQGFLVFSFRHLAPKKLIAIAVLLFALGSLWTFGDYKGQQKLEQQVVEAKQYKAEGKTLTKDLEKAVAEKEKQEEEISPEAIAEHTASMKKSYFQVVAFLAPINNFFNSTFTYRYDLFDVLSMMLLGIALFKLQILTASKTYRFYLFMAMIGYGIGLSVNYYETKLILDNNFSKLAFAQSYITYDLGRVPVAMGHVALIMIFCKLNVLLWLKKSLAAVGKMALTNYVMHSIFSMIIFTGVGFALFGSFHRHQLLYIVFSIWVFQLIISPIWLRYYHYGPLEWMWRNLSYGKRHAFRKKEMRTEE